MNGFRHRLFFLLTVALLCLPHVAHAQRPFSAREEPDNSGVLCGSQVILRLRTPVGKFAQRARSVAERLTDAVLNNARSDDVSVKTSDEKSFVIAIRHRPLLTVTRADARSAGSTPSALAELWARNLRAALAQPLIAVSGASPIVAHGEQSKVTFGTTVDGMAMVEVSDPAIADAQLDAERKSLTIAGNDVGKTTIRLRCGDASAEIEVTVKKRAGRWSAEPMAFISGTNVPPPFVARAALNAVLASLQLEPGSALSVGLDVSRPPEISDGALKVPIKISGPAYLPFQATADVSVQARPLPSSDVRFLLVSNAPENVNRAMVLRETMMSPSKPLRLLYHHKNVGAAPLDLVVELVNLNEQDAEAAVIEGNGGSLPDEIGVGHRAAASFLTYRESKTGYFVRVPAEQSYRIVAHRLPPQWTASGVLELFPAGSLPLLVRVRTLPSGAGEARLVAVEPELNPQDAPDWTFPQVLKNVRAEYRVGDRWAFIPFGRVPVRSADGKRAWEGNFGVVYAVTTKVSNPSSATTRVEFVFEPAAGVARGTFVLSDKIIESPLVKPPQEYVFHTVLLAPQETRTVTFYTLPQSGSNYPANIVVRSK
jgi:hypothetical protein